MTPQNPGDPDHPNVNRKSITTNSPTAKQKCAFSPGLPGRSGKRPTRRPCSSVLSFPGASCCLTRVRRERSVALERTGIGYTVYGPVCVFILPFFSMHCASNGKSLLILTLCVTTTANGETHRFGISCAADLSITERFGVLRLHRFSSTLLADDG